MVRIDDTLCSVVATSFCRPRVSVRYEITHSSRKQEDQEASLTSINKNNEKLYFLEADKNISIIIRNNRRKKKIADKSNQDKTKQKKLSQSGTTLT